MSFLLSGSEALGWVCSELEGFGMQGRDSGNWDWDCRAGCSLGFFFLLKSNAAAERQR